MKAVVIIPSRLESTRFPNKPLAKIFGREMILHVCDQVAETGLDLYVATPNEQIINLLEVNGYKGIMTTSCATGTDRVAQAAQLIDADIFINVQGDEPLVRKEDIWTVASSKKNHYNEVVGSMCRLTRNGPTIVKIIANAGRLIDATREGTGRFAQCGLYAFTKHELQLYSEMSEEEKGVSLKIHENVELMRFVDLGYPVRMVEIVGSPAVDIKSDIEYIQEVIRHGRR